MRSTLLLVLVACTAIALVDLVESTHSLSGSQAQALWSHSHKKSHKPDHRKDMRFRTEARSKDESGPAGAGGAGAGGAGGAPGGAGGGGDAGKWTVWDEKTQTAKTHPFYNQKAATSSDLARLASLSSSVSKREQTCCCPAFVMKSTPRILKPTIP